jgi:hypothetical protein
MRIGASWGIIAGVLVLVASVVGGCGQKPTSNQQEQTDMSASIEEVLEAHTDSLMAIRGVEGVGQGQCDDAPCIRVYASEMTPEIESDVPDSIEGYAVDVEVTGPIGPRSIQ